MPNVVVHGLEFGIQGHAMSVACHYRHHRLLPELSDCSFENHHIIISKTMCLRGYVERDTTVVTMSLAHQDL